MRRRSSHRDATPADRLLRARRNRSLLLRLLAAIVLVVLVVLDHYGLLRPRGDDFSRYDGHSFQVTHVVDGDTLDVAAPDDGHATTRIRFWGINCPEMDHPNLPGPAGAKPRQPYALEATQMTRQLAEGKVVRLYLEPQRVRDKYGRLLAYIELPDGKLLNEELLAAGLARADNRWNHRWLDRFKMIEKQAQHDHLGIWHDGVAKRRVEPAVPIPATEPEYSTPED